MINGFSYAFEDMQIILPGSPIPRDGVKAIEYGYSKEHTNVYGRGSKPVEMGRGKEEPSCKVTILQSLFEEMQAGLLPGKTLVHISPFTITVAYAPEGGEVTVDHILFSRVKSFKKGMKNGDGSMDVELEIVPGDILFNVL